MSSSPVFRAAIALIGKLCDENGCSMTSLDPTKQFDRVCVATPTLPQAPQPPNQGKRLVSLGGYASARSSESSDSVDRISGLTALLSTCRGLSRLVSDDPEPRRIVDVIVQGRKPSSRVE